jgi:DnaJ-class molecular chaperone
MSTPECYYSVLKINNQSNREQIAEAFRCLSVQNHPMRLDKDNFPINLGKLNNICEAFEVLCDEKLRFIYDKHGYQSLRTGIPDGEDKCVGYIYCGNAFKIFNNFFGFSNPYCESFAALDPDKVANMPRAENCEFTVECTLNEMYNGSMKEVSY